MSYVARVSRNTTDLKTNLDSFTLDTHELSELERCPAHLGELRDKPLDVALGEHERAGRVLVRAMRRASQQLRSSAIAQRCRKTWCIPRSDV